MKSFPIAVVNTAIGKVKSPVIKSICGIVCSPIPVCHMLFSVIPLLRRIDIEIMKGSRVMKSV